MKITAEKGSGKHWYDCTCQFSFRHILSLFLLLLLLVVINLLASTSKLSLAVDVSMKMKSNVLDAINSLVEMHSTDSINGTFTIRSRPLHEQGFILHRAPAKIVGGLILRGATPKNLNRSQSLNKNITETPAWYLQRHPVHDKDKIILPKSQIALPQTLEHVISLNTNNTFQFDGVENTKLTRVAITGNKTLPRNDSFSSDDKRRKDSCDTCFQHNFNYIIDNPDVCKLTPSMRAIDLLVIILTVHQNVKARNAIRETWLSYSKNNTGNVRYVFLLGEVKDIAQREKVVTENSMYHDIIKEDFVDTYMNLTYKTVMGYKWAATKCKQARFVLKTDDDMFVNINNLLNIVKLHNDTLQTAIGGACNLKARPIRNKNSKWYASYTSYPNSHYPGFCSGTGYITSMSVVKKLYEISPSVPFFHLEDVYSALCIRKLGYTLKSIPGFNPGRPKLDPCIYKGTKLVTAHRISPTLLRIIWNRKCVQRQRRQSVQFTNKNKKQGPQKSAVKP